MNLNIVFDSDKCCNANLDTCIDEFPIKDEVKSIDNNTTMNMPSTFKPRRGKKEPAFFTGGIQKIINAYNHNVQECKGDRYELDRKWSRVYMRNSIYREIYDCDWIHCGFRFDELDAMTGLIYNKIKPLDYDLEQDADFKYRINKHRKFYFQVKELVELLMYPKEIKSGEKILYSKKKLLELVEKILIPDLTNIVGEYLG
jgi:hypothetical protein